MSKVVIIGGGASGIIAALKASYKHEVILLEAGSKCGKKILLTGNGRCNYWNSNIDIDKYYSDNFVVLEKIISDDNQIEALSFLDSLGIYPKIKDGYYYPYSNQASSIREILLSELERRNVRVIYDFRVDKIIKKENGFSVSSNNTEIICDKVIISTGSCACPKTGSDGSGYDLAKSLGHTVNSVTPALVQLKGNENYFKNWDGVRCDSRVSLIIDGKIIKEDTGEIQLTDYGVSGICTFNISGLATKNLDLGNSVSVKINFLPYLYGSFYDWFNKRNKEIPNHKITELLESVIPYKLMFVLLEKAKISRDSYWDKLNEIEKKNLCDVIEKFNLDITGYNDFDRAQVATGGVSLNEINPNTMESNIVDNLYITGEVLDIDGNCGGYNLAVAFITGYLAGKGV